MQQGRVYRTNPWVQMFALSVLAFCIFGTIVIWSNILDGTRAPLYVRILLPPILLLIGCASVAHTFISTISLFEDAIELRTILGTRRLQFDQIRGRREWVETDSDGIQTRYMKVEPIDPHLPTLEFQRFYNFDRAFYAWFESLQNLSR